MKSILALGLVALTLVACGEKKKEEGDASASASDASSAPMVSASASAAMAASAMPVATAARGIPSQADEAVAASKEIDKTNYKKELDAIDKELK